MAYISTWELVSAVSNAGGLGIIGDGFYQPDWLQNQIRLTRQHTDQPFGVNIQMASPFLREKIDIYIRKIQPVMGKEELFGEAGKIVTHFTELISEDSR